MTNEPREPLTVFDLKLPALIRHCLLNHFRPSYQTDWDIGWSKNVERELRGIPVANVTFLTKGDVLAISGMGVKSLAVIEAALAVHGLGLRASPPVDPSLKEAKINSLREKIADAEKRLKRWRADLAELMKE